MASCLRSGTVYETRIVCILSKLKYKHQTLDVQKHTASASHANDIVFSIGEKYYGIECKNKGAFEGGGCVMKLIRDKLEIEKEGLLKTLYGSHTAFDGKIPSFLKGDKTYDTWKLEKEIFQDEYISVDAKAISDYYKAKGSSYIQIEGKGLYHTGNDILEVDVPFFEATAQLRIRTSKHIDRKTKVPRDVSLALVFKRNQLKKSPFCIETNIPSLFSEVK